MTKPMDIKDRLMRHVKALDNGCWEWTGSIGQGGYGRIGCAVSGLAHVTAYVAFVGPVPEGHELDHTCHNRTECAGGPSCRHRRCVNPAHLEPVTRAENVRRGHGNARVVENRKARTHCPKGHPYDEANTYWYRGYRMCRKCHCETEKRRYRAITHPELEIEKRAKLNAHLTTITES